MKTPVQLRPCEIKALDTIRAAQRIYAPAQPTLRDMAYVAGLHHTYFIRLIRRLERKGAIRREYKGEKAQYRGKIQIVKGRA